MARYSYIQGEPLHNIGPPPPNLKSQFQFGPSIPILESLKKAPSGKYCMTPWPMATLYFRVCIYLVTMHAGVSVWVN